MEDEKKELEEKLYNDCNVEIDLSDYENSKEAIDYIQDNNLCDEDVIYYSTAIKYLSENDSSLKESMEIASEFGYETKNINSELLATLLKSRENQNNFYGLENDIENYYDELETLKDEEIEKFQEKIDSIENIISDYEDFKIDYINISIEKENHYVKQIEKGNSYIEILQSKIDELEN